MSGELTSRPKGSTRHAWDWYVEQQWVTHRLLDMIDMEQDVTYLDPFCGGMNIPDALGSRGLTAFGTDLFQRTDSPRFMGQHDFLGDQVHLLEASPALSIVMNPPFSYQDGRLVAALAERCCRRALAVATHKVCALLPLKWLGSQGRYRLFNELTPTGIWVLTERPSMPPGDLIEALGDDAFAHGKIDYMWIVWDKRREPMIDRDGRPFAPTFWIPPREKAGAQRVAA